MKATNIHERVLIADISEVGKLLDSIASKNDGLWPRKPGANEIGPPVWSRAHGRACEYLLNRR